MQEAFLSYGNFFRFDMEASELSQWLKANGLSDYCKVFWDAGFCDLKSVASLTEAQLREAGVVIRNRKTANKLLREFDKLESGRKSIHVCSTCKTKHYLVVP